MIELQGTLQIHFDSHIGGNTVRFLEHHPKLKLFLQSASFLGYIVFTIIQCSRAIDRNTPIPNTFIGITAAQLSFPSVANAIGFIYCIGGFLGFIFAVVILQALTSAIKDTESILKE